MLNNSRFLAPDGIWAPRLFNSSFSIGTVQSAIDMMPSLCIADNDARVLICSSLIPLDFALFLVVLNELSERIPRR